MDSKIIGADRGFTSNVMLAKISYKTPPDPGTAPEKLVIKIMGADLKVRGIVDTWIVHNLIFPNEVRFFSECNVSDCEAEFPLNYFSYSRGTDHLMMMEVRGFLNVSFRPPLKHTNNDPPHTHKHNLSSSPSLPSPSPHPTLSLARSLPPRMWGEKACAATALEAGPRRIRSGA